MGCEKAKGLQRKEQFLINWVLSLLEWLQSWDSLISASHVDVPRNEMNVWETRDYLDVFSSISDAFIPHLHPYPRKESNRHVAEQCQLRHAKHLR